MNPCPCGHADNPHIPCVCSPYQILRYRKRLSGPFLDRIDMAVQVPHLPQTDFARDKYSETSDVIRARVQNARNVQLKRFSEYVFSTNSDMLLKHVELHCALDSASRTLVE